MVKKLTTTPLNIAYYVIFLIFACSTLGAVALIPEHSRQVMTGIVDTFGATTQAVIVVIGLGVTLATVGGLLFAGFWLYHRSQQAAAATDTLKAGAIKARFEALQAGSKTITAPVGHQVIEQFYDKELAEIARAKLYHLGDVQVNGRGSDWSDTHVTRWQQWQAIHAPRNRELPAPAVHPMLEAPGRVALLDLLEREQRLLILGPSGSGKSSLLKHVVSQKIRNDTKVLLCDPHGSRPKWGPHVDAVGFGERFEQILETFQALEFEHKERIRKIEFGHAERDFQIVTVVIEEVQALVEYFTGAGVDIGYFIRMFLTRTRKTGLDIIAVSQEDSVKALGVEGFGKNRGAFATARTTGRDGHTEHKVILQSEQGEPLEFQAPPFWPSDLPVGVDQNRVIMLPPPPSVEEQAIIEALRNEPDASDYKLQKAVFNGKVGSSYVDKINAVKAKFGPF